MGENSADGRSFVLNSTDLGGTNYNCYVVDYSWPFLPKPRVDIQELGGADGAATQGANWSYKTIELNCMVAATSHANLLTQLGNIKTLLLTCQSAGEQSFVLDDFPSETYQARLISEFKANVYNLAATFTLQFVISYPWTS